MSNVTIEKLLAAVFLFCLLGTGAVAQSPENKKIPVYQLLPCRL